MQGWKRRTRGSADWDRERAENAKAAKRRRACSISAMRRFPTICAGLCRLPFTCSSPCLSLTPETVIQPGTISGGRISLPPPRTVVHVAHVPRRVIPVVQRQLRRRPVPVVVRTRRRRRDHARLPQSPVVLLPPVLRLLPVVPPVLRRPVPVPYAVPLPQPVVRRVRRQRPLITRPRASYPFDRVTALPAPRAAHLRCCAPGWDATAPSELSASTPLRIAPSALMFSRKRCTIANNISVRASPQTEEQIRTPCLKSAVVHGPPAPTARWLGHEP